MSATKGPFAALGLGLALGLLGCEAAEGRPEVPADTAVRAQAPVVDSGGSSGAVAVSDSARWTIGVVDRPGGGMPAVLREVRTARQEGFDRIVLDFGADPLPGYHIEYVDTPQHGCGSGEEIRLAGDAWLSIKLQVAQAHTDSGEGTVRERRRLPDLPNLRELRLICDYEGHVEWVAGVGSPNPFRVLELTAPSRLVVDIRQRR